jgi:integrase
VHFHNRRFDTLTHDEVADWFAQRVSRGAQVTKHRISKNSRAFLRFARERGYTKKDLASAIAVYRAGGSRVEWLEWQDVHALLAAIPDYRHRMAAAWLFFTGCRVGEACAARQQDVQWRSGPGLFQWSIPDTKTHVPRSVWLPPVLADYIEATRKQNRPKPEWPMLWDCEGRGFARVESSAAPITPRVINNALEQARDHVGLPVKVTAHVAKHSYCSNWIRDRGDGEIELEKLSRQVGTSVAVLRSTYVHITLGDADWEHLKTLGSAPAHRP